MRILTKTTVESHHIPSKQENSEGLKLTQTGIRKAIHINTDMENVNREINLLEKEVAAIMYAVEKLGNGSIARGAARDSRQKPVKPYNWWCWEVKPSM